MGKILKVGDKVICDLSHFAGTKAGVTGVVEHILPHAIQELYVAIVRYRDGTKFKIPCDVLIRVGNISECDEVTITRQQFRTYIDLNFGNMSQALVKNRLKNLEYDIFGDPGDNV